MAKSSSIETILNQVPFAQVEAENNLNDQLALVDSVNFFTENEENDFSSREFLNVGLT